MSTAFSTPRFALVTGAGSGIGRACALALLQEGWTVGLVGRRDEALRETAAMSGAHMARAVPMVADVGQEPEVAALFARVKAEFGRLDLLFNNAGMGLPPQTPDQVSAADWRRVVDVNLNGAFYCLSHAFGLMREQSPQGGLEIARRQTLDEQFRKERRDRLRTLLIRLEQLRLEALARRLITHPWHFDRHRPTAQDDRSLRQITATIAARHAATLCLSRA